LGVIHRQPSVSGEELLPISGASALLQLEFVSAGLCSDGDGDGVYAGPGCTGGPVDCDDADPDVYPGAGELNDGKDNQCPGDPGYGIIDELAGTAGFTIPGDPSQLCWPVQPGATQYEVIRSPAPDFSVGCASFVTAGSCWTETGSPATGVTWYYLVRPVAPFVGSWGQDATGNERTIVCP
jgi:hypothetical protein